MAESNNGDPATLLNQMNAADREFDIAQYGEKLVTESTYRPGEGITAYVDRLFSLYPDPIQKDVITAAVMVNKAHVYGERAIHDYAAGVTPPKEVRDIYAPESNTHVVNQPAENNTPYLLLSLDTKNEWMTQLNVIAGHLKNEALKRKSSVKTSDNDSPELFAANSLSKTGDEISSVSKALGDKLDPNMFYRSSTSSNLIDGIIAVGIYHEVPANVFIACHDTIR